LGGQVRRVTTGPTDERLDIIGEQSLQIGPAIGSGEHQPAAGGSIDDAGGSAKRVILIE
jgi:hypothetical protein